MDIHKQVTSTNVNSQEEGLFKSLVPEQVVEESPGILADGVSVLQNSCIQKWSRWRIEGSQARLKLRFSLWSEPLSKKVVHDGAHADEALLAQSVPVHAAQDVDCLIHLTTVEVLEDEVDQAQLSLSEDA